MSIKYDIYTKLSPHIHLYSHTALLFYIIWHLFCWNVQGLPAYPFLIELRIIKYEILFYILGFFIMSIKNSCLLSINKPLDNFETLF